MSKFAQEYNCTLIIWIGYKRTLSRDCKMVKSTLICNQNITLDMWNR